MGALSMHYPPLLFVNEKHAWQQDVMVLTCKVMIIKV